MPDTDNVETKFVKQVLSVQEEEKEAKGNVTDRDDGTYATDGAPSGFTRLYHERESSPVWIRGKCHTLPVPRNGGKKGQSHLVTLKMVFAKTLEEKHSRFLGKVFDYCTNTGPTNPLHSWKSHGNDE